MESVSGQDYLRYTFRPRRRPRAEAAGDGASRREVGLAGAAARCDAGPADETLDLETYDLLAALQPAGWEETEDGRTLRFWLPRDAVGDPAVRRMLDRLAARGRLTSAAQEAGWEDGWRRFHRPVVEGAVRVRPPWYPSEPGRLDVVVEGGRAFGTGAHATTRLCLRALQQLPRGSLLDAGAGSGVLALAALRLGFAPVWAVDIDPVAVEACARNAAANGLELHILEGDVTDPALQLPTVDVVVANLLQGAVLGLAARLRAPDGGAWAPPRLLLSGLLVEQGDEAEAAFADYRTVARRAAAGWLLLDLMRKA